MNNLKLVLLIVVLLLIVALAPFATIWSMNTLFSLSIEYTFWTWLATVWISLVTFGGLHSSIRAKDGD